VDHHVEKTADHRRQAEGDKNGQARVIDKAGASCLEGHSPRKAAGTATATADQIQGTNCFVGEQHRPLSNPAPLAVAAVQDGCRRGGSPRGNVSK